MIRAAVPADADAFAPDGAVGFDEKTGLNELRLRAGIPD